MEVIWKPIEHPVYAAIYASLHQQMTVFATHTCDDDGCQWHSRRYVLTEWGFKGADAPLIRGILQGPREAQEGSYWIACVKEGDDE